MLRLPARLPRHVGIIPDGNRRWAALRGEPKENGYAHGIEPGFRLFDACARRGIEELTVYGFTKDNTKRPAAQTNAYRHACTEVALELERRGAALLVVGDESSEVFPSALQRFRLRTAGKTKVNLLVNYGWQWDLEGLKTGDLRSQEVSRVDLIIRWGGGRRLSGFLPVQSVYADFYVLDSLWPDFVESDLDKALFWFSRQDRTLGG